MIHPAILLIGACCVAGSAAANDQDLFGSERTHGDLQNIKRELGQVSDYLVEVVLAIGELYPTMEDSLGPQQRRDERRDPKKDHPMNKVARILKDAFEERTGESKRKWTKTEFDDLYEDVIVEPCNVVVSVFDRYTKACEEAGLEGIKDAASMCKDVLLNENKRVELYSRLNPSSSKAARLIGKLVGDTKVDSVHFAKSYPFPMGK